MKVKPWEPVSFFSDHSDEHKTTDFHPSWLLYPYIMDDLNDGWFMVITLANGQRIIVRALSENRKAARATMKTAEFARQQRDQAMVRNTMQGRYGDM